MPGTSPSVRRTILVILTPSPTLSIDTSAVVCTRLGLCPALPSPAASAIEKHAACAAPMSSSGFVPGDCSKREPNEEFPLIAPLAPEKLPLPSLSKPFQVASALRVGICCSCEGVEVERGRIVSEPANDARV